MNINFPINKKIKNVNKLGLIFLIFILNKTVVRTESKIYSQFERKICFKAQLAQQSRSKRPVLFTNYNPARMQ